MCINEKKERREKLIEKFVTCKFRAGTLSASLSYGLGNIIANLRLANWWHLHTPTHQHPHPSTGCTEFWAKRVAHCCLRLGRTLLLLSEADYAKQFRSAIFPVFCLKYFKLFLCAHRNCDWIRGLAIKIPKDPPMDKECWLLRTLDCAFPFPIFFLLVIRCASKSISVWNVINIKLPKTLFVSCRISFKQHTRHNEDCAHKSMNVILDISQTLFPLFQFPIRAYPHIALHIYWRTLLDICVTGCLQ